MELNGGQVPAERIHASQGTFSSLIKFYIYTVEGAYKHCLLTLCLDCILTCFSFEQFEDVVLGRLFR